MTTAIKDSEIRTLELLAEMRKENQLADDRIEALVADLRVDFAEFAASGVDGFPAVDGGSYRRRSQKSSARTSVRVMSSFVHGRGP